MRVTRQEQQAVRALAKSSGMTRVELLRRYSINAVVEEYQQLAGGK